MPNRDGTGPLGNGPAGRGYGRCQNTSLGRGLRNLLGFGSNNTMNQKSLESRANCLGKQAAASRNVDNKKRKGE